MKAMLFAAGLGTRLKPLTDTMPKALVPLAGKPLLQWQVEKLRDAGITDIIVNVHHFPDMIIDTIRQHDGWGVHITISDERDELLDTGGGLRKIHNSQFTIHNEPLLACNVDILSNIDLKALIEEYDKLSSIGREGERVSGLLVVSERATQRYLYFDEQGMLQGWTNKATGEVKPASLRLDGMRQLAFSGMQVLSPEVLRRLEEMPQTKFSLIDFYLHLVETNQQSSPVHRTPLMAYEPSNYRMMDVGKIDQIEEAEKFAQRVAR